jgi:2-(1,2-epoxy-1,2-dihydrophenyl)acetyl-CoA isomerase
MADNNLVLTEIVDRVATITINRPARRNALNGDAIVALDEAVNAAADNDVVKIVILTGAAPDGERGGFCSGGDTKDGGNTSDGRRPEQGVPSHALEGDLSRHERHAAMLLHTMPKPSIAMVGGPAVGAGASLAAACDFRFASTTAVFASGFSANGLSGDYGGSFFWTSIMGTARTREFYLLNNKISAEQALRWGMVHAVLAPHDLHEYCEDVAQQLLGTPADLLGRVKDNLNQAEIESTRRQFLFANEAENQGQAAASMQAKLRRP